MAGRRYEVLGVVGTGSAGTVYHARMHGEGGFVKDVALKVLHPRSEGDVSDLAQRLRDEARVLGLVSHRAVIGVDALVKLAGRWTVVMEYVPGANLLELTHGPTGDRVALPVRVAVEVLGEVASALDVAFHTRGPDAQPLRLLHRDLKPSNVRLTRSGEVRLLDFGFAKAEFRTREARTRHMSYGSLGYVPHEQLEGRESPRGDIYSMGVVFYEMLAGETFGQTPMTPARHDRRLGNRLTALRQRKPEVHPAVIDLVQHLLSFRPEERPLASEVEQRCSDLASRLDPPGLRQWARQAVPAESRRLPDDPESFVGRVLHEDGGIANVPSGPTAAPRGAQPTVLRPETGASDPAPAEPRPGFAPLASRHDAPSPRELRSAASDRLLIWVPLVGVIGLALATGALLIALLGVWLGKAL